MAKPKLNCFCFVLFALIFVINCNKVERNRRIWELRNVEELTCDGMEDFYDEEIHDNSHALAYNRKMYRVMSNMRNLQDISMRFSGKPVSSKQKLQKACVTSTGWENGQFSAFGKVCDCRLFSKVGPTRIKCIGPWNQSKGKHDKKDLKFTYIWTDNKKYTLHLNCKDKSLNWALSSTMKESPSARIKKIVLRKITAIGFNPKNAVVIPHDSCPE